MFRRDAVQVIKRRSLNRRRQEKTFFILCNVGAERVMPVLLVTRLAARWQQACVNAIVKQVHTYPKTATVSVLNVTQNLCNKNPPPTAV